jgi:hypothetical protein
LLDDFDKNRIFRGLKAVGGCGSGNWQRFNSKALAEDCLFIDICQLSRKGLLEPGQRYSCKWHDECNISIETTSDAIELFYTISSNELQYEDVHIKIPLSWTSCNYGGERSWFLCPGKDCGRQVAKLYLYGKYFLCRRCHDLTYSSQRRGKEWRQMDKAQRTYQRLGVNSFDDLCSESRSKPKGMHRATYDELVDKAQELEFESLQALKIKLIKNM